jgi:hypothetical protein
MRTDKRTHPVIVMVTRKAESVLSLLADLDEELSELYVNGESRHNFGINRIRDSVQKSHKALSAYTDGLWNIGKP